MHTNGSLAAAPASALMAPRQAQAEVTMASWPGAFAIPSSPLLAGFDGIAQGVALLDGESRLVCINAAARAILASAGWSIEQSRCRGRTESEQRAWLRALEGACERGQSQLIEMVVDGASRFAFRGRNSIGDQRATPGLGDLRSRGALRSHRAADVRIAARLDVRTGRNTAPAGARPADRRDRPGAWRRDINRTDPDRIAALEDAGSQRTRLARHRGAPAGAALGADLCAGRSGRPATGAGAVGVTATAATQAHFLHRISINLSEENTYESLRCKP